MNVKDLSIVLADSSVNFKIRYKYFVDITNTKMLTDASQDAERKMQIEPNQGLLLQPNVLYKFVFVADDFNFTENEELSVGHFLFRFPYFIITIVFFFKIARLELAVGLDKHLIILSMSSSLNTSKLFKTHDPQLSCMDNIVVHNSCYIVPT